MFKKLKNIIAHDNLPIVKDYIKSGYKGWFLDEKALTTAQISAKNGDYALVGINFTAYIFDSNNIIINNNLPKSTQQLH